MLLLLSFMASNNAAQGNLVPGQLHRRSWLPSHLSIGLVGVALMLAMTACGGNRAAADTTPAEPVQIRPAHPTFTPTPVEPAAAAPPPVEQQTTTESAEQPAAEAPPSPPEAKPQLVINTDLVNLREGPGTNATIITILKEGERFDIIGKNAAGDWWFICCFQDKAGWVTAQFADVEGPVDTVPVVAADAQAPTRTPEALAAAPANTGPTPLPQGGPVTSATASFAFDLVAQEQFPEPNVVRIYLYVFDDRNALAGYSLRVTKDGEALPVGELSFGPNSAFTWPVADPRQRAQNLKVEFPGVAPGGVWEVQLTLDGAPVGPPATFTLGGNDVNRELYVRYRRQ